MTETNGLLYLNSSFMIPYAIAGIKELDKEVKDLKARNKEFEERLEALEKTVGAVHEPPKSVGAIHESPLRNRRRMVLSMVIGYFKMNSAKRINATRKTPGNFIWQRNYYDHVIRNDADLNRAREYILNNPSQWEWDDENPANAQGHRGQGP